MCRWSSACSRCCSANQPVQGIFSGYRRMACFAPGVGKHKMHVPEFLASTMYAAMCTMTHSFRLNHVARVHARTVLRAAATAEGLPTRAPTAWSILWHPWCRRSLRTRGLPSHICECNAGRMAHFTQSRDWQSYPKDMQIVGGCSCDDDTKNKLADWSWMLNGCMAEWNGPRRSERQRSCPTV